MHGQWSNSIIFRASLLVTKFWGRIVASSKSHQLAESYFVKVANSSVTSISEEKYAPGEQRAPVFITGKHGTTSASLYL